MAHFYVGTGKSGAFRRESDGQSAGEAGMGDSFTEMMAILEGAADAAEHYSDAFTTVLPVTGAAVSTLGDVLGSETISATDDRAARLDERQFDLGEGPCWDAMRSLAPVSEPAFASVGRRRWPAFTEAIRDESVASIFAFPLAVGTLRLGAIDLYSLRPVTLDRSQVRRASAMAEVIGRRVLRGALEDLDGSVDDLNPRSRRLVHQATGIVLAQLQIAPEDARLVIQGHAFATSRSMMDVAADITEGRLRFLRRSGRIEATE
ncbi:GAF and ANTAR domain-containing protein [Microbacterium sp. CFBP9034]|uniref:GAF and ANTAR domain-containing protein n=1 Tax=Microbacterium sp. CFBP9034 TaxID=3096540 RepID=UPI002A6B3099|nr:GAF and ANTAR domain-containing protein [Microbacterium sp. CFBP9034]MDY0910451.1 GAF and ANTAR domain-containing protein [Microbacterium sp. CFBP9034]